MNTPTPIPQDRWLRTFPMTLMGIMSCYWTDIERKHVVPKYAGQIFHFVDLNECWMYLGDPEPEPEQKPNGVLIFLWVLFLLGLGFTAILAWEVYDRLEWLL